jgi:hypothetical protein
LTCVLKRPLVAQLVLYIKMKCFAIAPEGLHIGFQKLSCKPAFPLVQSELICKFMRYICVIIKLQ